MVEWHTSEQVVAKRLSIRWTEQASSGTIAGVTHEQKQKPRDPSDSQHDPLQRLQQLAM